MRFYHYTAPIDSHLGSILASGIIRTTESNGSLTVEHMAPDVVWGTDQPITPNSHLPHGLLYSGAARMRLPAEIPADIKTRAVIECEVPDAVYYADWIKTVPHDPDHVEALIASAGGWEASERWLVVPRPITDREFVSVTVEGQRLVRNAFTGEWEQAA